VADDDFAILLRLRMQFSATRSRKMHTATVIKGSILRAATEGTLNPAMFSSIMARTTLASNLRLINQNGAVAQLGERLNGIQEVRGSIPLGSTNQTKTPNIIRSKLLCEFNI
jgi:hypothetical protein